MACVNAVTLNVSSLRESAVHDAGCKFGKHGFLSSTD
jgi:hypothetical protein